MKQRPIQHTSTKNAPLYNQVFYGLLSKFVVFLLLVSFVIQPIERAEASEENENTVPELIDTSLVPGSSPTPLPSEIPQTEPVEVSAVLDVPLSESSVVATSAEEMVVPTTTPDMLPSVGEGVNESNSASSTVEITTSSSSPDMFETPTTTPVIDTPPVAPGVPEATIVPEVSTNTVAIQPEVSLVTSATTTELLEISATSSGETLEATASFTADSLLQFNKSDCVAVADGSYYCKTNVVGGESYTKDGLFSKPDVDGDLEIFFAHNGTLDQITFNDVDDSSPYFDSISNTIVWHRLINDRYQIMSHDVRSGSESQLTTDSVNNMEPTRAGTYTVWQHWNTDNWDIMLYDGVTTKLITSVPEHDIAPKIRGNLVIWNRLSRDSTQTIELYDLTTGEYTSIADSEGGELSNPRMVLVYDAQFQNGDVVTKGYDVDSREITELTAIPVAVPENIPTPDTTGETRALIQVKSTGRDDSEVITIVPTIDPPEPDFGVATTASSTVQSESLLPPLLMPAPASTTEIFTLDLSASSTVEFTETDLLVPPFSVASTTQGES